MHTPATALPPGLGTLLGLCASPGGTTVVGREGVSRSDWSSDRRLRRGSPAPGTESTEGPRPEGPGPGEPGRDQQPLTAPLAALADLNWPRESSPRTLHHHTHVHRQRRAHSHTHTPTYTHDRAHLRTPPHTYPHTHMDTNSPSHTCSHVPSQIHTCTHRHKHSHTQDTPEHTLMQAHALTYTLTQRSRCHTPRTQARSSTPTPLMVTRTITHSYTLQRGHTYTRPQRTYTRGHTPKRTPHGLTHNCHCTLRHRDTHELTPSHTRTIAHSFTHTFTRSELLSHTLAHPRAPASFTCSSPSSTLGTSRFAAIGTGS